MAVLVSLQLEVFVLVTNLGLWSKILTQTIVAGISEVPLIYKVLCIGTMIVSPLSFCCLFMAIIIPLSFCYHG